MKKDVAFIIGRFQPFHEGHMLLVERAFDIANNVCFILGSSDRPRSLRNPFTYGERVQIILNQDKLKDLKENVYFLKNIDYIYSEAHWKKELLNNIRNFARRHDFKDLVLLDHTKEYYEFKKEPLSGLSTHIVTDTLPYLKGEDKTKPLSSTYIRNELFNTLFTSNKYPEYLKGTNICIDQLREVLYQDFHYYKAYNAVYDSLPYPPVFLTVDVFLFCFNHVLLVKRKRAPGKGLLALPGGFFDANKDSTLFDAALRELKEETGIQLPEYQLKRSLIDHKILDFKYRSDRGRVISHTYCLDVTNYVSEDYLINKGEDLHKVPLCASDDAAEVGFVSFKNLHPSNMFEDHFDACHSIISML